MDCVLRPAILLLDLPELHVSVAADNATIIGIEV